MVERQIVSWWPWVKNLSASKSKLLLVFYKSSSLHCNISLSFCSFSYNVLESHTYRNSDSNQINKKVQIIKVYQGRSLMKFNQSSNKVLSDCDIYSHNMYQNRRLFSQHSNSDILKINPFPCRDLNPRPPSYQADVLPIELFRLGSQFKSKFNS